VPCVVKNVTFAGSCQIQKDNASETQVYPWHRHPEIEKL